MKSAKKDSLKGEFTNNEAKAIYRLTKEYAENAPESEEDAYNDHYDTYEEPISKKVIASILKKISKYLPKEEANEIDKDFLRRKYHTFNNNIDPKVYSTLKKAFGQLKRVNIKYFNMESAEFKERNIDVYYTSSKYTIGYCHLRKDIRKFRTSRIASAKLANSSYKIPEDFDKNNY